MRMRGGEARSSLEAEGEFTGWEEEGAEAGGNILQQFKKNLNDYERGFNELARAACKPKRRSHSVLKDVLSEKENCMKLPALNAHARQDYCAFLDSDFARRSAQLQEGPAGECAEKRAPKVLVYIETRKHNRCESFVQFCRNKPEGKPANLFLKKHKVFSISRTLKLSKIKDRRVSTKLISCEPLNKDLQCKYSSDITLHQQ